MASINAGRVQGASIWNGKWESYGGVTIDVGTSNIKPLPNDLVIIASSTPPTAKKVGDVYKITRIINSTNPYQCYIGTTPLFSISASDQTEIYTSDSLPEQYNGSNLTKQQVIQHLGLNSEEEFNAILNKKPILISNFDGGSGGFWGIFTYIDAGIESRIQYLFYCADSIGGFILNINDNSTYNLTINSMYTQPLLYSGTNIKTINNQSILGSGNIDIVETGVLMLAADPQDETELDISNARYIKLVLVSTDSTDRDDGVLYINALDDEIPSDSRNDVEINVSEKIGIGATIEFGQYADMGAFVKYDEGIGSSGGITYTWLDYSLNTKLLLKFRSRTSSTTLNVVYEIIRT